MVDEDVPEDGQLRVEGGHLAILRFEGGAEPPERRGRVQLRDLPLNLLGDQLALQICGDAQLVSFGRANRLGRRQTEKDNNIQCSCFPVSVWPGGGTDAALLVRAAGPSPGLAAPLGCALALLLPCASEAMLDRAKSVRAAAAFCVVG